MQIYTLKLGLTDLISSIFCWVSFATPGGVRQCFCHSPDGAHFGDASDYNKFAILFNF